MSEMSTISKIRFDNNDYTIHDTDAHNRINDTNNTLSQLETNTEDALSSLSYFKSTTEQFLSKVQCDVNSIQNNEYELILNLNS